MKKVLSLLLIVIILASAMFLLTGCGNEKDSYKKETETFTIEREKDNAKLIFDLAKDLGYTCKVNGANATFENSENLSRIEVYFKHDYKSSSSITMEEKDFYADTYHDYEKITVNDHEGWKIEQTTQLITKVNLGLVLTEPDKDNKVYAVTIEIRQSPLEKGKEFNAIEFYKGEDFQHMLNSLKVEVAENTENAQ